MTEKEIRKKFFEKFPLDFLHGKWRDRGWEEDGNSAVITLKQLGQDIESNVTSIIITKECGWHHDVQVYQVPSVFTHLFVINNPGCEVQSRGYTYKNQDYVVLDICKEHRLFRKNRSKDLWVAIAVDSKKRLPKKKVLNRLEIFLSTNKDMLVAQ